jgi:uroporphyrinogen III methyltransferase/synthase
MKRRTGTVYLVGAGPGDPGLLTLRGAELLRQADVVVRDPLVNPALLRMARPGAEIIARRREQSSREVLELLIERARAGKKVVHLYGGDPYVFGRGDEMAAGLRRARVPFEVVSGVSSVVAAPAAAGIPLTPKGLASSFTVTLGPEGPDRPDPAAEYARLARATGTRVVLMGEAQLRSLAARLQEHGLAPKTPVAVIQAGTTPRQETVVGTLADIADRAEAARVRAPAVIVIGEVVRRRKALNWFESRPLFGRRVVVTRARARAGKLVAALDALGAETLSVPCIRTAPPSDLQPLAEAILGLNCYDWVIFTSANGVDQFFAHFFRAFDDLRHLGGVRLAAVGPATAARLEALRLAVDLTPKKFEARQIARELARQGSLENLRVLLLRAEVATPELPALLEEQGAIVDDIAAYRTVAEAEGDAALEADLRASGADWITFTSGSTVEHFHARFDLPALCRKFPGLRCATIGPETSKALRALGLSPAVEARPHTVEALVHGLVQFERKQAR